MRRFRFVGDPNAYLLNGSNIEMFMVGDYYSGPVIDHLKSKYFNDWQEVFDEPKPLHKDTDLGYFAGLAMQGILASFTEKSANGNWGTENILVAEVSVSIAKELIKQLDKETK